MINIYPFVIMNCDKRRDKKTNRKKRYREKRRRTRRKGAVKKREKKYLLIMFNEIKIHYDGCTFLEYKLLIIKPKLCDKIWVFKRRTFCF